MAEVFLALSGHGSGGFNKLVVLKVLKPELAPAAREHFLRMFQDEGRLAVRLNHPNIVQAYEVGSEGALSFIIMEYLEGQPLSAIQERGWNGPSRVSLEMQLQVLCQVLEGLEYAHRLDDYDGRRLNIVHRDVSPQNVFVTYSGHTKLVDFGIAKTLESSAHTAAGVVKGKLRYISPEQLRGARVDHRADLFSVGVMLWEAIARRSMHGDASMYEVIDRVARGAWPPLRDAAPDVPRRLEPIVARALSADPALRYPDAGALRDDLLGFLDERRTPSSRELGESVARLFDVERKEIAQVVQRALREAASAGLMTPLSVAPTVTVVPGVPTPVAQASAPAGQTVVAMTPSEDAGTVASLDTAHESASEAQVLRGTTTPTPLSEMANEKRWSRLWLLGAAGLAAATLVVVSLRPPPVTPGEKTPSIRLQLRAEPPSARFAIDGQALQGNPYGGERTPDAASHILEVTAEAHEPQRLEIALDRDLNLHVYLAELPAPAEVSPLPLPPPDAVANTPPRPERKTPPSALDNDDLYSERHFRAPRRLGTSDAPSR